MNDLEPFFFYPSALAAILSAVGVISVKRTVYSVLLLVLTMISLSVLFILLGAPFVAMIQILIYAGAILVLFLLVNMLLGIEAVDSSEKSNRLSFVFPFLVFALFVWKLLFVISKMNWSRAPAGAFSGAVEAVGMSLFSDYLLPFELTSVILLTGIFGVVSLAQKETLSESAVRNLETTATHEKSK